MTARAPGLGARLPLERRGFAAAALAALVLLAATFLLKWYGPAGMRGAIAPRPATEPAQTAWQSLGWLRWLIVGCATVALLALPIAVVVRSRALIRVTAGCVLVPAAVLAGLLVNRVFISLPEHGRLVDQKLGAVVAVLAAATIAAGGLDALRWTWPDPSPYGDASASVAPDGI